MSGQGLEATNGMDGNSKADNPSFEVVQNDKLFVERFAILFNSQKLSDITLCVGDDRYYAHKFVLVTCSEVFQVMLNEARWRESNQQEIPLTEEDECVRIFPQFLRYMYTGSVGLTTNNVLPILLLADKYSVPTLGQVCVDYMMHHIVESPDTNRTLSWYQYAKITGNDLLVDRCRKFILSNFDIILKTADWMELSKAEVVEFISSSDLVVSNEYDLWLHVEKWLTCEHNKPNLKENVEEIIPLLRFMMISPKNLLEIENSQLCEDYKAIFSKKLHTAYRYHSLLLDDVDMTFGTEKFRNYLAEIYGLCVDLMLPNYHSVDKIDSKIIRKVSIPVEFISNTKHTKSKNNVLFEVMFWPKGCFKTFSWYGPSSENVSLHIRMPSKQFSELDTAITFLIFGVRNGVRNVALTYKKTQMFSQTANCMNDENIISLQKLQAEQSPYLINGNLEAKLFIKIQNVT